MHPIPEECRATRPPSEEPIVEHDRGVGPNPEVCDHDRRLGHDLVKLRTDKSAALEAAETELEGDPVESYTWRMEATRTTRASWKNSPLPTARTRLQLERSFTSEEHRRLTMGLLPQEMEDKWFIFFEDGWLYLHRSWTGICIYAVHLRVEGDGSTIEEAWVNREPSEYKSTDDAYDTRLLGFLIDRLLLGRNVPFPALTDTPKERASLLRHNIVGHARANDEK